VLVNLLLKSMPSAAPNSSVIDETLASVNERTQLGSLAYIIYLFIYSVHQPAVVWKYKQRTYWQNGQHRVNKPFMCGQKN